MKSSTNAQEGLQNLDDSTRSVAPQVCRSQEPKLKLGLQHAATGLFRSQPVPSDWKSRQEMQTGLQIKSKKTSRSYSESVLYLLVGEYSSTTYSDRLLKSDPRNWQMEGGQTRKYEDASFLENVFETENPGVRQTTRI